MRFYEPRKVILRIKCIDEIGQTSTFLIDKKTQKQYSPSFDSFASLMNWARKLNQRYILQEMKESNII